MVRGFPSIQPFTRQVTATASNTPIISDLVAGEIDHTVAKLCSLDPEMGKAVALYYLNRWDYLTLGYSHTIVMNFPDTVETLVPAPTEIIVQGADKELVGMIAAKIRSFRKPEPYKGKGVRYSGEHVRRKAGKTGAA